MFPRLRCACRWRRCFSTTSPVPMVVTTPIFYVNAKPHVGHIYSAIIADSFARWKRLLGHRVRLVTGTDEHGNKVRDAAAAAGQSPQTFCDRISAEFEAAIRAANCEVDDFVRTTSERHVRAVQDFWTRLRRNGHIYLGEHQGWYCRSDEAFVPSKQVESCASDPDKKVLAGTNKVLEHISEPNYKFRLSNFHNKLHEHLVANPNFIEPLSVQQRLVRELALETSDAPNKTLEDLSVSRLVSNSDWAIRVPDDAEHSVYVWLDALINYLTVCGYPDDTSGWPAECHVIGKDILRFHAVYWPSFLMAAGLQLPKRIVAHAHWTVDGVKMSKSIGNVLAPDTLASQLGGADAMRYFLLRIGGLSQDGDICLSQATQTVNGALADRMGNLYARSMALLDRDAAAVMDWDSFVSTDNDGLEQKLLQTLDELPELVRSKFERVRFDIGLQAIDNAMMATNRFFTARSPWRLRRESSSAAAAVVLRCLDAIRRAAILLQPVCPRMSGALLDHLQVPTPKRRFDDAKTDSRSTLRPLPNKFHFFQRLETETTAAAPRSSATCPRGSSTLHPTKSC